MLLNKFVKEWDLHFGIEYIAKNFFAGDEWSGWPFHIM